MKTKIMFYFLIFVFFNISIIFAQNHKHSENEGAEKVITSNYLDKLKEGNIRFFNSKIVFKNFIVQREELIKGQSPHTVVVTCSDSRVPPEYIFDVGLGEIFVVRTAGNVVDSVVLGSIEYAVEHLHSQQIVVMGHTYCGAVTAAVKGKSESAYINSIISLIFPAVEKVKQTALSESQLINNSIEENAKLQIERILESKIISEFYNEGKLKIYYALYDISNGFVKFYERVNKKE